MIDLKRLKELYPLFSFELKNITVSSGTEPRLLISYKNRTMHEDPTRYNLWQNEITNWHAIESTANALMLRFPHLYISVAVFPTGIFLYVWIKRDDRSGEAFQHAPLMLGTSFTEESLCNMEKEAETSTPEGWFYCTGHSKAEVKGSGMYSWFAGSYCADYGKEHPKHLKEALAETYN